MSVKRDDVNVVVMVDGKQAVNQLGELEMKSRDLKASLKDMKKGTEEYIQANKQLDKVTGDIKQLRNEIGLAGMTMQQLRNNQRDLNRELNNITPGTARYQELKTKLQEVNGVIAKQQAEIRNVGDAAKQSGGFMNSFMGSFAAGILSKATDEILAFGKGSVQAFEESKQATAQLQASLKSTGEAAGLTQEEIMNLSNELKKQTGIDDDATNATASLLLTFTNIKKGVFEEALPAIQDLAVKMGGDGPADMKGASIQVGKALNDPIKGITALSKVGVSFTQAQKDVITQLVKTGDVAGAQKIILAELNTEFGGSAKAAYEARGAYGQLSVTLDDIQENLGERLLPAVEAVSEGFISVMENTEPVEEAFAGYMSTVDGLYNSFKKILTAIFPFNENTNKTGIIMKVVGLAINLSILPFRALATYVQLNIDAFAALINTGKKVSNFFGSEFKIDPDATFGKAFDNAKENIKSIGQSYSDIFTDNEAKQKASTALTEEELKKQEAANKKYQADLKKMLDQAEQDEAAKDAKKESDKAKKEADKLKREEERIKREQAAHEKQLEGFRKAEDDYTKLVAKQLADKEKKDQELEQKALNAKFAILDLEILRARGNHNKLLQLHIERLQLEKEQELKNAEQTGIARETIEEKYAEKEKQLRLQALQQNFQQGAQIAQQAISDIQGFIDTKAQNDITSEEKTKASRLAILDQELKSKKISQETYEKEKTRITTDEDKKIAAYKNKQAQADKAAALAQAVIAGALAVIKALPNAFAAAAAGITAGIGIAKIIATPIPKFADGGPTSSFAGGGHVGSARLGLIGEKGPEYVISNPMLKNPRVANFVCMLENMRTARAFADGGFTTTDLLNSARAPITPDTNTLASSSNPGNIQEAKQNDQLSRQLIVEVQGLRQDFKEMQTKIHVAYTDIEDVAAQVNKVRVDSSIS
jgi:myosin heavy subunit